MLPSTASARARKPRHRGVRPLRTPQRAVLATTAIITMLAGVFIGAPAATADDLGSGVLSLAKTVEVTTAQEPGETFVYSIGFGCSSTTTGCVDAVLTDTVPSPLEVVGTPNVVGVGSYNATVTGNDIRVEFSDAVSNTTPPSTGLADSTTGTVQVTVRVPVGLDKAWDGQSVVNSAEITAVNADPKQDDVAVQLAVPTEVDASVAKSWSPTAAPYLPGTASTVTITAGNESNIAATSLTVLEPSNPDAAASFFAHYDLVGLTSVAFPQGADLVRVDARVAGTWQTGVAAATAALPVGVDADAVEALRVTFSSSTGSTIAARGTAGNVVLAVEQRETHREDLTALAAGGIRVNSVSATVVTPEDDDTATGSAQQEIAPLTATVTVGKTFDVAEIPAGQSVTATITATNTSTGPLTELAIQEPLAPNVFFTDAVLFAGFDPAGGQWPDGATSAEISWLVSGGAVPPATTVTDLSELPTSAPSVDSGQHVTGFVITFTGEIEVGAAARFGVKVDTTADAAVNVGQATSHANAVRASGTNAAGTGTADDSADLLVWVPSIELGLTKTIRPADVYVGGHSLVELAASTPPGTGTVRPHEIVVTEPATPGTSEYWNAFTPVAIGATSVPLGSVLTIEYHDGTDWEPMDGTSGEVTGPQVFAANLSDLLPSGVTTDDVMGLRFTFADADGFGRNTNVKPAIVFQAQDQLRDLSGPTVTGTFPGQASWASYENCSAATAADAATPALTDSASSCATARIIPTVGGPGAGLADKAWDDLALSAQSRADTGVTLTWGVQAAGFETVTVSDVPAPSSAAIESTVFQAFDLVRIDAITAATDPLIRWDAVTKVELYSESADGWVDVTAAACAGGCTGTFAGYTLTDTERADTIGVQLTFAERADRATVIQSSPMAPPVGSGVASAPAGSYGGSSTQGRTIHLDLELRSVLRVPDGQDYVTATRTYNHADAGVIRNDLGVVAHPFTGADVTVGDSATIMLQQHEPTAEATKTVSPTTPVTIPRPDVAQADYPHLTYTTTVRNTTPSNVTALRLTDPSMCTDPTDPATCAFAVGDIPFTGASYDAGSNPFERVNLAGIDLSLSAGSGITDQTVHLWHRDSAGALSASGPYTAAQAEALGAAALSEVVGLTVLDEGTDAQGGTIVSGATATVVLDVQLRRTMRSTGAMVAPSIIPNTVLVGVHDSVLNPALFNQDVAAANAALAAGFVDVVTDKVISPTSTLVAAPASPIRVDLRVRSTGTVSPKSLTVEDSAATFWNAFTASSVSVPTMPTGADRVEIFAMVDGSWVSDGPTTGALAALPAAVDVAQITGVRALFTHSSGGIFVGNNNAVNLRLLVELRDQLRDGSGPVTADSASAPMPGETLAGRVTNTVQAGIAHDELSDSAADTEVFRILTGTATMAVEKTSVGQSAAGKDVPFTLRIRNTGTGYLVNPVVIDQLPADGSLVYVPTDVPVYSTTAGGTLTTNPVDVTRSYDAATGQISFAWPSGSLLAPGETYSITLRLQMKPGLTAGTAALNGMQATNDRQVAACTAINPGNGRTVALNGNTCSTDNVVTVLSIGSFSASKGVRSQLGTASNTVNPALACTPDAQGYYRYPCAADTMIGDVDEWRLQLVNGGTIGATTLQFVDVFPHPGDRGVVDPSPRGSGYVPTFLGDVGFDSTIANIGFEWFYTTDAVVCTDDLFPGAPACSAGDWHASSTLTAAAAPDVTSIKAVFDFSALPGGVLPPASTLAVTYSTINEPSLSATDQRAPMTVPVADVRAWNSFGYYPTYSAGANPPSPEEPIKAGVVLTSGSMEVAKVVTGTETSRAPSSFGATVECTVSGAPVIMGTHGQLQLEMSNNFTARIDGLPAGANCTVNEDGILGWYGESSRSGAQSVTVAALATTLPVAAGQSVEIVNVYEPKLLPVTGPQALAMLASLAFGLLGAGLLLIAWRRRLARD